MSYFSNNLGSAHLPHVYVYNVWAFGPLRSGCTWRHNEVDHTGFLPLAHARPPSLHVIAKISSYSYGNWRISKVPFSHFHCFSLLSGHRGMIISSSQPLAGESRQKDPAGAFRLRGSCSSFIRPSPSFVWRACAPCSAVARALEHWRVTASCFVWIVRFVLPCGRGVGRVVRGFAFFFYPPVSFIWKWCSLLLSDFRCSSGHGRVWRSSFEAIPLILARCLVVVLFSHLSLLCMIPGVIWASLSLVLSFNILQPSFFHSFQMTMIFRCFTCYSFLYTHRFRPEMREWNVLTFFCCVLGSSFELTRLTIC